MSDNSVVGCDGQRRGHVMCVVLFGAVPALPGEHRTALVFGMNAESTDMQALSCLVSNAEHFLWVHSLFHELMKQSIKSKLFSILVIFLAKYQKVLDVRAGHQRLATLPYTGGAHP